MADRVVVFRLHAIQRMFERGILAEDTIHVLENGTVLEEYPNDTPYPSRLLLGWPEARPLHVVEATDLEHNVRVVITVYEPDPDKWNDEFTRRKK